MLNFKPVTLSDKPLINGFLKNYGSSSCQHSLYLLTGLSMKYGDEYAIFEDVLFIHRSRLDTPGKRVYLAPLGNIDSDPGHFIKILFVLIMRIGVEPIDCYNKYYKRNNRG